MDQLQTVAGCVQVSVARTRAGVKPSVRSRGNSQLHDRDQEDQGPADRITAKVSRSAHVSHSKQRTLERKGAFLPERSSTCIYVRL